MKPIYKRMLKRMEEKAAARRRRHRKTDPWFVYILRCADGSLYTGITNDLPRRFKQHNDGTGARYTRTRRPVTLAYREECRDRSAALVRECAIKAYPRPRKQALVAGTCAFAPSVAKSRKKATSPGSFRPARPGPRRRSGRRRSRPCAAP
jgi:putative endonuclease